MFNNKDFYPTPSSLIGKMLNGIDWKIIRTILDPSAGKGDLLEAIIEKEKYYLNMYNRNVENHYDIDCIEYDENLQHILKGKNYRLVYNDFLTYNTMKQYDLIVMNPPFADGEKHLLKALELQQNGGAIVCLLNAETLKNPYSNTRKDLTRKLTEYNAEIEFIKDAFMDAERTTGVEIALIKVLVPELRQSSFIIDGLKKAQEQREYAEQQQTSLAENDFYKAIVNQYNLEVKVGINFIKEYHAMSPYILSEFKEDGQKGTSIITMNVYSINGYIKEVRKKYWRALFKNDKFTGTLTDNLKRDFHNQIEALVEYDFSLFNIYEIKIDMNKKVVKGIEETIISLFEELSHKYHWFNETSNNIHFYNGWKTNKSWIINKKVIIPLAACEDIGKPWEKYRPSHYKLVEKLTDIEKSLNYLDGGITEGKDVKQLLQQAEESGITKKVALKYFTLTFFKKGTCHIEFTNLEVLKKFNIFGSQMKNWLPPSYGKQDYKDMTSEEKQIVTEFEGEKEYEKTLLNKKYYIYNSNNLAMLEDKIA